MIQGIASICIRLGHVLQGLQHRPGLGRRGHGEAAEEEDRGWVEEMGKRGDGNIFFREMPRRNFLMWDSS